MQEYELTAANGYAYRVQLSDEDAERYGKRKPRRTAENKKAAEETKSADDKPAGRPGAARRRES